MILEVDVFAVGTTRSVRVPAKIDTGADLCVLPTSVVASIRLVTFGHRMLHAVGHPPYEAPTYRAEMIVDARRFQLEVVTHSQAYALLGRDLINEWILIADGPAELFELRWPDAGTGEARRRSTRPGSKR
jgi:hypothetical protein